MKKPKSKLDHHLPEKDTEAKLVSPGLVPRSLFTKVQTQKDKEGLTWNELQEGLFRWYLEERAK